MAVQDRLLTTGEVAALLWVDPTTVRRWSDAGRLTCLRTPGGHRRYPAAGVQTLLEQIRAHTETDGPNTPRVSRPRILCSNSEDRRRRLHG